MRKIFFFSLIAGILVIGIFSLASSDIDKKRKTDLFQQVKLFSDTLAIVQNEYVEEVDFRTLIYGALRGMVSSLDPHSQFMDPDTYNELKIDTEGKFGGLGIEITVKDGLLTIVTPIEDTPAWKAGLKPNDRIVKINNEITRAMTLAEAVKKLRGKPQEAVEITVLRESENKIIDFRIVRDIIRIKDIKEAKVIQDAIAYIRLVEFRENTPQELEKALEKLKKEGMNGLILDLRNNPGGLLDVAVKVAEKFIPNDKLIVSTKGRKNTQNMEFISHAQNPVIDMPMAVLINEGSASGSEIVAGCLQDYNRAIILGVKSFGKGSVQTVIPLRDGSALRLTTSLYFTPQGKKIHGKGVMPDITVENAKLEPAEEKKIPEKTTEEIFEEIEKAPKAEKPDLEYKKDNQLMRGLDTLKALLIYGAKIQKK